MTSPPPPEYIRISVHGRQKAALETQAAKEGITLNDYVRNHLNDLIIRGEAIVDNKGDITVQNPWYPNSPPQNYVRGGTYPPNYYAPPQGDAIDAMINDMRKIFVAKMLSEMVSPKTPQEYQEVMRILQNRDGKSKNGEDDMSYDKMMKYNMMQAQMDREMMRLQNQMDMYKTKGDTKGEKGSMEAISTLIAAQQAQNSQFMQQFGLMTAANQNAQTSLFTTAMGASKDVDSVHRQERDSFQQRLDSTRQEFWTGQMDMMNKMNEQQLAWLNNEMIRIRSEKPKDMLAQLQEIVSLRDQSPIMKAAFDTAFGVQQESMIGKILPQLKDLGIDKVIQDIVSTAKNIISKPAVPAPKPVTPSLVIPPPSSGPTIPTTSETTPSSTPLENLQLPDLVQESSQTPQPKLKAKEPTTPPPETSEQTEESIGYTNLDNEKK